VVVLFNENIYYVFVFVVVEEFRKLMLGLGLYSDIQREIGERDVFTSPIFFGDFVSIIHN
jgi:hypothetical protein